MPGDIARYPEELRYLILALQRQGNRRLNGLFRKLGLTTSQAEALEIIGTFGPMSTRDVGAYLVCESGSPSRLLASLAAKGLTLSSRSTADKRATLHALTPEGRQVLGEIVKLERIFEAELADTLNRASEAHPGNMLSQLAYLLTDRDLESAMKSRYPHMFNGSAVSD